MRNQKLIKQIARVLKDIQSEYRYIAMDQDGKIKGYTGLPQLLGNHWAVARLEDRSIELNLDTYTNDYEQSLFSIEQERFI